MRTEYVETRKMIEINELLIIPDDGRELLGVLYTRNSCHKEEPVLIVKKNGVIATQCNCGKIINDWRYSLRFTNNIIDPEEEEIDLAEEGPTEAEMKRARELYGDD